MGNNESQRTEGEKKQADPDACKWYKYLDLAGNGEFVKTMETCMKEDNFTKIDKAIRDHITKYLYEDGEGKMVNCSEIVHERKKCQNDSTTPQPSQSHSRLCTQRIHPDVRGSEDVEPARRFVCWKLDKRGTVGETLLHLCFLNMNNAHTTPLFVRLVERLLWVFPNLIADIYVSGQYFGENILHMAIVNEDKEMVEYLLKLLDPKKDGKIISKLITERAFGFFFSCHDQKSSRIDIADREEIILPLKTDYQGYVYLGEYPLSFAACLGLEEIFKVLFSYIDSDRDSDLQMSPLFDKDHNGNNVLHMLVIHNRVEMFDTILSSAGSNEQRLLASKNAQGFTPLSLAAALANKEAYNYLMNKERKPYWVYGDVACAAYPLAKIDSIGTKGEINPQSVLHCIIYGEKPGHLEMVDGMVENLLKEKWSTFLRLKFYGKLFPFLIYCVIFAIAVGLRPSRDAYGGQSIYELTSNGTLTRTNQTWPPNFCYHNGPPKGIKYESRDYAKLILEGITLIGALLYFVSGVVTLCQIGARRFFGILWSAPSLCLFYFSCICVLLMCPARIFCSFSKELATYDDVLTILAILMTAPHFLFFFRGFKTIGPFVTMIYKMLAKDLLRFFTIYVVFLIGFSQSMYVVHISYSHPENKTTPFSHPVEALMGMFYMSMGEFSTMYEDFEYTRQESVGKFLFVVYMILVFLLLINMLIALMGNTFALVSKTSNEWFRQWAHIALTLEQTLSREERIKQQKKYSQENTSKQDGESQSETSGKNSGEKEPREFVNRWQPTKEEREDIKKQLKQVLF